MSTPPLESLAPVGTLERLRTILDLADRGLSLIPIERRGKVPVVPWKRYQRHRATLEELSAWFDNDRDLNVGVATGAASGVVVVDADSPTALAWCTRALPYTAWQTRTARGWHLWFRHPGEPVGNRSRLRTPTGALAIDVRGDGGYVVVPPSVHASGASYAFAGDWSLRLEEIPTFQARWLAVSQPTHASESGWRSTHRPSGDVVDRARAYLATIPLPEIGHGSDAATLYAAARLVRGFALPEQDATALLWDWAGGRPGWTHDWIARKVRNAMQYGTEPVGALR